MSNQGKWSGKTPGGDLRGRYRRGPFERRPSMVRPEVRAWRAIVYLADQKSMSISDVLGWMAEEILKSRGMSLDDAMFDPPLRRA